MSLQSVLLISYAILWAVVVLLCVVSLVTLRYLGLVLGRSGHLNPLVPAILNRQLPDVAFIGPAGLSVTPSNLGGPLFVLVVAPGCQQCELVLSASAGLLGRVAADGLKVLLVVQSTDEQSIEDLRLRHSLSSGIAVWRDPSKATTTGWDIEVTPAAIVVDSLMRVKWVDRAPTPEWITSVVGRSTADGGAAGAESPAADGPRDIDLVASETRILAGEAVSNG